MFLSRVGRADTKGLFASCPHSLGIALGWAPGLRLTQCLWPVGSLPPPTPAQACIPLQL